MNKNDGKPDEFGMAGAAGASGETLSGKEVLENRDVRRYQYMDDAQKQRECLQELKRRVEVLKVGRLHRVNLYVKNLDDTIDEERLRKEFSPFGTITTVGIIMKDGKSKGYGFVCFSTPGEASRAIAEMNGRIVASKALYVAHLGQRREAQAGYLENMSNTRMNQMEDYNQPGVSNTGSPFVTTANASTETTPEQAEAAAEQPQIWEYYVQYVEIQKPLTAAALAMLPESEQKQTIGEELFPLIHQMYPELAGKITGMLLDLDNDELLSLLVDHESLKNKVEEAINILNDYHARLAALTLE